LNVRPIDMIHRREDSSAAPASACTTDVPVSIWRLTHRKPPRICTDCPEPERKFYFPRCSDYTKEFTPIVRRVAFQKPTYISPSGSTSHALVSVFGSSKNGVCSGTVGFGEMTHNLFLRINRMDPYQSQRWKQFLHQNGGLFSQRTPSRSLSRPFIPSEIDYEHLPCVQRRGTNPETNFVWQLAHIVCTSPFLVAKLRHTRLAHAFAKLVCHMVADVMPPVSLLRACVPSVAQSASDTLRRLVSELWHSTAHSSDVWIASSAPGLSNGAQAVYLPSGWEMTPEALSDFRLVGSFFSSEGRICVAAGGSVVISAEFLEPNVCAAGC